MRFKLFCAVACACAISLSGMAEAPKFKDGDRICFIGDSITHGGIYHTQVLLFYATRFPEMRFDVWNRGISGDTAYGCVKRFSWDIAPCMPTVATIMLGMNDVRRDLYAEGKSGDDIEAQRQKAIASCKANMEKLAGLLTQNGVKLIFITPSIFDQTGSQKTDKLLGVNDALRACADSDKTLAGKFNAGVIDFNAPMEAINKEGQAKNPDFTIVGNDRVHPGAVGHLVMAYLFLKEQGMDSTVASMEIDAAKAAVVKQVNCGISTLSAADGKVSFVCLEKSLPFPVDYASLKALELVPFIEELNQETLKVTGLPQGKYEILIDGVAVSQNSDKELANGINLAVIKTTPQYKQALQVQKAVQERAAVERKLRLIAQVEHGLLSNLKERTPEAEKLAVEKKLEQLKSSEGPYNKYSIGVYQDYQKYAGEKESFEKELDTLLAKVYSVNKPVAHVFELRPVAN